MRIWSLHPMHLDRMGLIACWRETLLAQAVLAGRTRGYRQHPQLTRFRTSTEPIVLIGAYLSVLADEADQRGYRFDRRRIDQPGSARGAISVTEGQLAYEWCHLGSKLDHRSPEDAHRWRVSRPTPHPLFTVVPGDVEHWERQ